MDPNHCRKHLDDRRVWAFFPWVHDNLDFSGNRGLHGQLLLTNFSVIILPGCLLRWMLALIDEYYLLLLRDSAKIIWINSTTTTNSTFAKIIALDQCGASPGHGLPTDLPILHGNI